MLKFSGLSIKAMDRASIIEMLQNAVDNAVRLDGNAALQRDWAEF